jgi:ParB family chromosome partitioning protein
MDDTALAELAASISRYGILQPLLFRAETGENVPGQTETRLIIVAGERRFKAAAIAGLSEVPALFVGDRTPGEISLIENLQRQDLTSIEEAEALQNLLDSAGYTQKQLSDAVGKSAAAISENLSLMKLPQKIRDDCRGDRQILRKKLLEIAGKTQQRAMFTAYDKLRAQMAKPASGPKPARPRLSPPAFFVKKIDEFAKRTRGLDTTTWPLEEIETARQSLSLLREDVETLLARIASGRS